jgi:ATP-dependent protease ClpP protease subunit
MTKGLNIFYDSKDDATIDIEGFIGSNWWKEDKTKENTNERIKKELSEIKAIKATRITVNIHSLGGDVDHALAIYDALKEHPATIITKVTGMCASAATIIMMAGKERKMSNNALILIHKCSSFVSGNENKLAAELAAQKTINERIVNLYISDNEDNKTEIESLMEKNNGNGKWISASEAKEVGLITDIYNESKKAAVFTKTQFTNSKLPALPTGYEHFIEDEKNTILEKLENITNFLNKHIKNGNQFNNENTIQMKKLFPIIATLLAVSDDFLLDEKKGITLTNEQLEKLENELKKISDLEAEKARLATERANLETENKDLKSKMTDLQTIVDKIPTDKTKIEGGDDDDKPKTYADKMKNSSYYQDVATEFGKTI